MVRLSRFAEEIIFWSTDEAKFITLSDAFSNLLHHHVTRRISLLEEDELEVGWSNDWSFNEHAYGLYKDYL